MVEIYEQLNTKTIGEAPSTDIATLQNPVHLQAGNKELLADINLINQATFRDGRPIPGTGVVDEITLTDGDSGVKTVLVSCNGGEVKIVNLIGGVRSGGSADVTYQFYLREVGKTDLNFYFTRSSDSGILFNGDSNYPSYPIVLDENVSLVVEATGTDYTSVLYQAHTYRVR